MGDNMNIFKKLRVKRDIKKIQAYFDNLLELGVRNEEKAVNRYSNYLDGRALLMGLDYEELVPYLSTAYGLGVTSFVLKATEMRDEVNKELGYKYY